MKVKLSVWAGQVGVSYKTAQRWYYAGKMPVPTGKTPTGRIMVIIDEVPKDTLGERLGRIEEKIDNLLKHSWR